MKLKNGEIWRAYPKLIELSRVKLPIKPSIAVAKLANKLQRPYAVVDGERGKLVAKYGKEDEETRQTSISVESESWADFIKELDEMFDMEWDDDIQFSKVKLPEKVTGTCDKCNHNMDVTFQVEPEILIPLEEKFVEVI